MEPLDQLLRKSVKRFGLESIYVAGELAEKWSDIVGVQLAKKTAPLMIKKKVLLIRTINSGWSHQLTLLKPVILERLKSAEYVVEDLRFICKEKTELEPEQKIKTVPRAKSEGSGTDHKKPKLREAIDSYLRAQKSAVKNKSGV